MVLTSVLTLAGIGLILALILVAASLAFRVEEDPRVEAVLEALPGANCGGCGYAGCEAYAQAVLASPDVPANLCTVGGNDTATKVGEIAGKTVTATEPMICFRRCSRHEGQVEHRYHYVGVNTCSAAAQLEGGPYMCSWSCLGYGDCMRACPFDAMVVRDDLIEVITSRCVACGCCISACPRGILQIVPQRARVMCFCATKEKMKNVADVCSVGCINCLQCVKACPAQAISYTNFRIEINHNACLAYGDKCGEACVASCSRNILRDMRVHGPAGLVYTDEAGSPQEVGHEHQDDDEVTPETTDAKATPQTAQQAAPQGQPQE